MGTRIRYIKEGEALKATRFVLTTNGEAMVYLYPEAIKAKILVGDTVEELEAKSMASLKLQVKKALKSMGAVFSEETRNKAIEE